MKYPPSHLQFNELWTTPWSKFKKYISSRKEELAFSLFFSVCFIFLVVFFTTIVDVEEMKTEPEILLEWWKE